jgi:hypothetical protein
MSKPAHPQIGGSVDRDSRHSIRIARYPRAPHGPFHGSLSAASPETLLSLVDLMRISLTFTRSAAP